MESLKIIRPSLLFVLFFGTIAESAAISASGDHDEAWLQNMKTQFPRFSYLGQVEGKHFYVDFTRRNRDDSAKFCADWGLSIARIQKRTEGLFLSSELPPPNDVSHGFWVDRLDVQFVSRQNDVFYIDNYERCSVGFNVL